MMITGRVRLKDHDEVVKTLVERQESQFIGQCWCSPLREDGGHIQHAPYQWCSCLLNGQYG